MSISVARDRKASGARLKFDLDPPAESEDDLVLSEGMLLPEHLRRTARRLRYQFQALGPARGWQRGQSDGQEIDLDAYLRFATDRHARAGTHDDRLYRDMRKGARDLVCLLLSDLSLSTDTWVDDRARVIAMWSSAGPRSFRPNFPSSMRG
jgi:nitric oxide reductase NorD protein